MTYMCHSVPGTLSGPLSGHRQGLRVAMFGMHRIGHDPVPFFRVVGLNVEPQRRRFKSMAANNLRWRPLYSVVAYAMACMATRGNSLSHSQLKPMVTMVTITRLPMAIQTTFRTGIGTPP